MSEKCVHAKGFAKGTTLTNLCFLIRSRGYGVIGCRWSICENSRRWARCRSDCPNPRPAGCAKDPAPPPKSPRSLVGHENKDGLLELCFTHYFES